MMMPAARCSYRSRRINCEMLNNSIRTIDFEDKKGKCFVLYVTQSDTTNVGVNVNI